ncbi:unnamed protein product [Prunus brigantina]
MKMKSRVRRTFSLFFMLAALLVPLLLQALASHSRASATETSTHGYKEHCSGENGEEFKMEYETSRRFLAVQKFLSPGVLKRDLPVCKGQQGKPYGISCLPPPSNPSTAASWMSRSHTSCNASIAECDREGELLMESEISRRFLGTKKYISPGALKPDQPVCNGGGKGEAYSKTGGCLPPPSNPHSRGCSKYYRCRSDS